MASSVDLSPAQIGQNFLNNIAAPLLVGSWISVFLFGIEWALVYLWYSRYVHTDGWTIKTVIILMMTIDTCAVIASQIAVYGYTITTLSSGNSSDKFWQVPLNTVCTGSGAFILQLFLLHRYYRLSRNKVVASVLFLMALAGFGESIALPIALIEGVQIVFKPKFVIYLATWFSLDAATDTLIAVALIHELYQVRQRTKVEETRTVLLRLIILTLESGLLTSLWAIASLIVYFTHRLTTHSMGVVYPLGRAYTITLLVNLLLRSALRNASDSNRRRHTTNQSNSASNMEAAAAELFNVLVQTKTTVQVDQSHELTSHEKTTAHYQSHGHHLSNQSTLPSATILDDSKILEEGMAGHYEKSSLGSTKNAVMKLDKEGDMSDEAVVWFP